jgi:chromate transporter
VRAVSSLSAADWLNLLTHFLMLSLLSVGGAISTAPDMHRFVVGQQQWITDAQFSASIAIAQAAPGPNVLFVALLGWNIAGAPGALATMTGILLPSTLLSLWAGRWSARHRHTLSVRAVKAGLAPLTIGLLLATGWVLSEPFLRDAVHRWGTLALGLVTVALALRTRVSPLWLVLMGALVGALGGL